MSPGDENFARKRLKDDFSKILTNPPVGVSGSPRDDDLMTWDCVVCGLPGSSVEFGIFELTLNFPASYPFHPPTVKFSTEMFHPNISGDGTLILTRWSPAQDVREILTHIQSLLSQPLLSSTVNMEAAQLYEENRREYIWTGEEEEWGEDGDWEENKDEEGENEEDEKNE